MNNQEINTMMERLKKGPGKALVFIILIIVVFGFFKPWVQVGAGERGVVLNFGAVQEKVLNDFNHKQINYDILFSHKILYPNGDHCYVFKDDRIAILIH